MSTAAVILAAGQGSRFAGDEPKLRAPFRGRPLLSWALAAAERARAEGALTELIVVVGGLEVPDLVPDDLVPDGVVVVRNERWAEGMGTSLAAALGAAGGRGHDVVVIGLGDQPMITAAAWAAVASADAPIAVATYDGRLRNPVRLHRSVWPLVPPTGDEGARSLIRSRPDLVTEVPCDGEPADIDTTDDLARWG